MAMAEAAQEGIFLRGILEFLTGGVKGTTTIILGDNNGAIQFE